MACEMFLVSADQEMQLQDIVSVLRRSNRWELKYGERRRRRPLPTRKRNHSNISFDPPEYPDRLSIVDPRSGAAIHIQGEIEAKPTCPLFLIDYQFQQDRIELLRDVLLCLASNPAISIGWQDPRVRVRGSAFINRLESDPHWYWGYDPRKQPDAPFERT